MFGQQQGDHFSFSGNLPDEATDPKGFTRRCGVYFFRKVVDILYII